MWERTNVTNLLRNRQSGTYYARVKVNGKQKWRKLETSVFSVAKLRGMGCIVVLALAVKKASARRRRPETI